MSLLLAREANIFIRNQAFADELNADLQALIHHGGTKITAKDWIRASLIKRLASWIAYGMVRAFLGLIGHRSEH